MTARSVAAEQAEVLADRTHDHRRKIPALTGIRGYAAFWVVLHHCVNVGWHELRHSWADQSDVPVLESGYLGVDLFFILSGFVLMRTYSRTMSRLGGVRDFAVGRLFRILPIHWAVMLAFAAVTPLMHSVWPNDWEHSAESWFFAMMLIQAWIERPTAWNAPGWSLSAEWLAYFGFPVLALVMLRVNRAALACAMAIAALVVMAVIYHHLHLTSLSQTKTFGLARCVCEFSAGAALARMHQLGWTGRRAGDAMLVVGLILLAPSQFDPHFDLLAPVAFSLMVLSSASTFGAADRLFGNRVAHFLGEISFSIYITHWLLVQLVLRFAGTPTVLIAGLALLPLAVIPLAWATWRWIEVPGQAAGRKVMKRLRARDAARALAGRREPPSYFLRQVKTDDIA